MTCSVEGCDLKASVHGMCWGHDKQVKRGVPLHPVAQRKHRRGSQVPWLHAHVDHAGDECLKWPFAFHRDGRGQVTINGRTLQAHRVMCELRNGPPPTPSHEAAHSCGKGHEGCVHPGHLGWKTRQQNVDDTIVHGTRLRGEQVPTAKLTEAEVLEIRRLGRTETTFALGARFNVHPGTVSKINRGERWSHI